TLVSKHTIKPHFTPSTVVRVLRQAIQESSRDRVRYHHVVIWNGVRALRDEPEIRETLLQLPLDDAVETWESATAPTERLDGLRLDIIEWLKSEAATGASRMLTG